MTYACFFPPCYFPRGSFVKLIQLMIAQESRKSLCITFISDPLLERNWNFQQAAFLAYLVVWFPFNCSFLNILIKYLDYCSFFGLVLSALSSIHESSYLCIFLMIFHLCQDPYLFFCAFPPEDVFISVLILMKNKAYLWVFPTQMEEYLLLCVILKGQWQRMTVTEPISLCCK